MSKAQSGFMDGDLSHLIDLEIERILQQIIAFRRELHMFPELSGQEKSTSEKICNVLESLGVKYESHIAGYGIVAWVDGGQDGPCRAFRADMDALPIQENTEIPFKSVVPGVMHACGHDFHTATLLGSIIIANSLKRYLKGRVLYIFQPSEEVLPSGAHAMIEHGILNKYKPEWIFAQHVSPELPAGVFGYHHGSFMAASNEIHIEFIGKGGHAAKPDLYINPITMAVEYLYKVEDFKRQNLDIFKNAVLSFGKIEALGASNIIPDSCFVSGTKRTVS